MAESNWINGQSVVKEQVSRRSMNFGQHWRTEGIKKHKYEVLIPLSFFIGLVQPEMEELIQDYKDHPDPNDELEALFREADWPTSLEAIFISENTLLQVKLIEFFGDEILLRWFGDLQTRTDGYVINTIDQIKIEGKSMRFSGICRDSQRPVRYQDV